ncbi:LTA synthase family protein [Porcipelethomonas sp.]|uniref:LTA synthase family protein n=1 Tax=Porcipelethomonas sp. TaxID=2981675 RepID=UPI003EF0B683
MKEKFLAVRKHIEIFNNKREDNSTKYKMTNLLLTILFPVFIVCMAEINQAKYPSKFIIFAAERPSVMLFNILIASLIFYGLLLLFKKGWIAVLIQSFIYMALSITELFKYNTNGNHLILTDMKLVKSVKSLTSFAYIKITPMLITYVLIVVAYFAAVFWFNPKMKMKMSKRIAPAICCIAACISVVTVPAISKPVYSLFDVDTTAADNTFKLNEKFENNSFLAFFCQTASENLANKLKEPENYNDDTVEAMMNVDVENDNGFSEEKPNVIMIMSESLADFRQFEDQLDLDFGDTYDGFDAVAAEGYKGTTIVPTYASWTVRTEFELNFGLPVRSLNDPNMPQRMLLDRAQPTIASYYKSWGYSTAYIHPFMGSFYSRQRVYSNFGFDQLIFDEDLTVPISYYGTYIDDKTVFNQVEKLIEDTDEPLFLHTTTMQNHQPYDQGEDPDDEMGNYLQWIGKTGEDFESFINDLKEIDEPTVVFIVGDHYPSLKGENSVYDQLGMNGNNCSVLYEQPFIIWSNYDLDYSSMPDEEFSTFYVPYVLMDLIDAPRDSFIQAMMDKMETLPVYSTNYDPTVGRDEDLDILTYDRILGDIVSSNAIPEEQRKTAEEADQ